MTRRPVPARPPGPRRLADLTPRQRQVLELLVRRYLAEARPVGSQALAAHGRFAWAPATLRQTMLELEDLGLLEQPHAAAGRVPSDRGYRFFVDGLDEPAPLTEAERDAVEDALASSARDVERLLAQASRLLSELGQELAFAVRSRVEDGVLEGLELLRVGERRVLLVLTIGAGLVRSVTLELEQDVTRDELDRVARLLKDRLLGHSIDGVRKRLAGDDALVRDAAATLVAQACLTALAGVARPDVYAFGSTHVARHPELQTRLGPVLALIDRAEPWDDLVAGEEPGTVTVTIGREHARPEFAHLSLVRFRVDGPVGASIGLLGPRRMDYGRAIGLVDFVGRRLTSLL